jgi:hypothetical protein
MPRLRPLKKQEDIDKVAETESVLVDVAGAEALAQQEADKNTNKDEQVEKPVVVESDDGEATRALQKQLDDLTKAETASRERAANAERAQAAALEQSRTHQAELEKSRAQLADSELEAVGSALEACVSEGDAAQKDYEAALTSGDAKQASDAQRRLVRAEARAAQLESAKSNIEDRQKATKEQLETRKLAPNQQDQFEQAIASLPDPAKVWLRSHPDYMTDQRKNAKIQSLHWDALDAGNGAFTPKYFEFIEEKVGLREAPKVDRDEDTDADESERGRMVSAPVSRENVSLATGKQSTTRVTLSPSEREAARLSGITEVEYAKNKIKLQEMKKSGYYSEGR